MYDYFKGFFAHKICNAKGCFATVDVGGVGYILEIMDRDFAKLPVVGEDVKLYSVLIHREDKMALCGFLKREDRDIFNNIIDRVINKEKPFSGKDKDSDKGFKDVLQWESMIEFAKKIDTNIFLYITKNKNDFPKEIAEEFVKRTNKKIEIFYEIGELQSRILELNKMHSNYLLVDAIIKSLIDSGELIDIVNEKIKFYYGWEINKINKFQNLTDQSNNCYSIEVESEDENGNAIYFVECTLDGNENIIITDVVICA